jgi:hypothetical protein
MRINNSKNLNLLRTITKTLNESTVISTGSTTNPSDTLTGRLNDPSFSPITLPPEVWSPLESPSLLDDRFIVRDRPRQKPFPAGIQPELPNDIFNGYVTNNPLPPFPGENATPEQIQQYQQALAQWLENFNSWLNQNNYSVPSYIQDLLNNLNGSSGQSVTLTPDMIQILLNALGQIVQIGDYMDSAEILLFLAGIASGRLNLPGLSALIQSQGLARIFTIFSRVGAGLFILYLLAQYPSQYSDWEQWIEEVPFLGNQWWWDWQRQTHGIGWPSFIQTLPGLFQILPFGDKLAEWLFGHSGRFDYGQYDDTQSFIPAPTLPQQSPGIGGVYQRPLYMSF